MLSFRQFIIESATGANKHLEHIEDEILNSGLDGLRKSILYFYKISKILDGSSNKKIKITTKWDGAPAIIAGVDPQSGRFFVATKHGATSKTMKLNFTDEDIDTNHPAEGLRKKLKTSLELIKKLNMRNIYQGDLLYSETSEKVIETINDQKMVTFTPNTITYAVPLDSSLGKQIMSSKLGIIWHTKYSGDGPVNQMSASFDVNLKDFTPSKDVWYKDAEYENMDGIANFTEDEKRKISTLLKGLGKLYNSIDRKVLEQISSNQKINIDIKAHTNSKIREGESIGNSTQHTISLINYLKKKLEDKAEKLKTEKGREKRRKENEQFLSFFIDNKKELIKIFDAQNILIAVKSILVKKLQEIEQQTQTFIKTNDGYKVTNPEGFVAVSVGDGAVKLVDRLEFSMQNFSNNTRSF